MAFLGGRLSVLVNSQRTLLPSPELTHSPDTIILFLTLPFGLSVINCNATCFSLLYTFILFLLGPWERAQMIIFFLFFQKERSLQERESTVSIAFYFISLDFQIFIQCSHLDFSLRMYFYTFTSCHEYNCRFFS